MSESHIHEPDRAERAVKRSKFLSLILRHNPGAVGLVLDPAGWVDVTVLLGAMAAHGRPMSRAELDQVVADNDKQRFAFDDSGSR